MSIKTRLKELTEQLQTTIEETQHLRNEVRAANAVLLQIHSMITKQLITEVRECCRKPPSTNS